MANGTSSNMNTGIMDPNIMRLYDPQQFASNFGFMLPQIPIIPEMPETPVIKEKGDGKSDQFDPGTFNPNLLGQYVGYFNPSFPAAPGATGSPQEINNLMSSTAPTSIVGDELSFTPIGTNIQQEDEDEFGLANLLSISPTFRFFTQAVPEILGKVVGGITDAFNTKDTDPNQPDGKGPKTTPDTTGGFQSNDAGGYQQGPGGQGGNQTTGGASKQKQKENQALGKSRGFNYGGR